MDIVVASCAVGGAAIDGVVVVETVVVRIVDPTGFVETVDVMIAALVVDVISFEMLLVFKVFVSAPIVLSRHYSPCLISWRIFTIFRSEQDSYLLQKRSCSL